VLSVTKCAYFNSDLSYLLPVPYPERFMMDFSQTLTEILDSRPGLRAIVVRPIPRLGQGAFGSELVILQGCFWLYCIHTFYRDFCLVLCSLSSTHLIPRTLALA